MAKSRKTSRVSNPAVENYPSFDVSFPGANLAVVKMASNPEDATLAPVWDKRNVRGVVSATNALIAGSYKVIVPGKMYAHTTFAELRGRLGWVREFASVSGEYLATLVESGTVTRNPEIDLDSKYYLSWDGHRVISGVIKYVRYEKGEAEYVKHARNTLRMWDGFDSLFRAQEFGLNIELHFDSVEWLYPLYQQDIAQGMYGSDEEFKLFLARRNSRNAQAKAQGAMNTAVRIGEQVNAGERKASKAVAEALQIRSVDPTTGEVTFTPKPFDEVIGLQGYWYSRDGFKTIGKETIGAVDEAFLRLVKYGFTFQLADTLPGEVA